MSSRSVMSKPYALITASAEARNHLLGEERERLPAAVAVQDALAEQQEDLAERDVARRVLDHARDRVGVTDQERRAILAERGESRQQQRDREGDHSTI